MGPHMIKEGLTLRKVVLKAHPDLREEVDRVLDKSGKIVRISQMDEWNEIYIWIYCCSMNKVEKCSK